MFQLLLCLITLSFSLYFWGVLRTAIWLVPTLLIPNSFPVVASSLLSFWLIMSFFAEKTQHCFDLRHLDRQKFILALFGTGVLSGSLLHPAPLWAYGLAALLPLLCLRIFKLFRHPASEVLFIPRYVIYLLAMSYVFCILSRNIGVG